MATKKQPPSNVLAALQQAAKGLKYTSETEAALEPFLWDDGAALTPKHLRELAGAEGEVEEETLDDFLHAVPPEDKPKFDKLAAVLREQLSGIKVYKVGDEAEKQAFVVGKTGDGKWAGLKTQVVET
jgi:histidine triad (HIT) family protein